MASGQLRGATHHSAVTTSRYRYASFSNVTLRTSRPGSVTRTVLRRWPLSSESPKMSANVYGSRRLIWVERTQRRILISPGNDHGFHVRA